MGIPEGDQTGGRCSVLKGMRLKEFLFSSVRELVRNPSQPHLTAGLHREQGGGLHSPHLLQARTLSSRAPPPNPHSPFNASGRQARDINGNLSFAALKGKRSGPGGMGLTQGSQAGGSAWGLACPDRQASLHKPDLTECRVHQEGDQRPGSRVGAHPSRTVK